MLLIKYGWGATIIVLGLIGFIFHVNILVMLGIMVITFILISVFDHLIKRRRLASSRKSSEESRPVAR